MKTTHIEHFVAGRRASGGTRALAQLQSPIDGRPLGAVQAADAALIDETVAQARRVFESWSRTPVKERVQPLFRFKQLAEQHMAELSALVSTENGKTPAEAEAGIRKGLEVVEYACSFPQLLPGEVLEVSTGVDCFSRRYPLGVVAGITPFNFPAMVPLWMIPMAIGCGNTFGPVLTIHPGVHTRKGDRDRKPQSLRTRSVFSPDIPRKNLFSKEDIRVLPGQKRLCRGKPRLSRPHRMHR